MPTTSDILTLETVLESVGKSPIEFMSTSIIDLDKHNEILFDALKDIDISDKIPEDQKAKYKSKLFNWQLENPSAPTPLPETGQKILKGILATKRQIFDDLRFQNEDITQIGFYKIIESSGMSSSPYIIPSSINIQEHLLNTPVPVARSKSSGMMANSKSKHTVSIDIIFPNFEVFSSTERDYPSFINLYNMFKFMPMNSIYSSALCMAFVSQYAYPALYDMIGDVAALKVIGGKGDTKENRFDRMLKALDLDNTYDDILGLFTENHPEVVQGVKHMKNILNDNKSTENNTNLLKDLDSGGQDNGRPKFPVPVCFKSASMQTMHDMPGAILGRFSFGIMSSPAFPFGTILYRDKEGSPTLDPSECHWGMEYVSQASNRIKKEIDVTLAALAGERSKSGNITPIGSNDLRITYWDIFGGIIDFDTTNPRYTNGYEGSPLVLEKISGTFNTRSIDIPLMGSKFPMIQYMGLNSNSFQLIFAVRNKKIIADFMAMKAKLVSAEASQTVFNSFGWIENQLINSLGVNKISPQSVTIESDPDSPDLYRLILTLVENTQSHDTEKLVLEKGAVSTKPLEAVWEYFYKLYKVWWERKTASALIIGPGELGDESPSSIKDKITANDMDRLDSLMRVLGLTDDLGKFSTVLAPESANAADTYYQPIFMGIIYQYALKRTGRLLTGDIYRDLEELVLIDSGLSTHKEVYKSLLRLVHGAMRADKESNYASVFGLKWTEIETGDPLREQEENSEEFRRWFEIDNAYKRGGGSKAGPSHQQGIFQVNWLAGILSLGKDQESPVTHVKNPMERHDVDIESGPKGHSYYGVREGVLFDKLDTEFPDTGDTLWSVKLPEDLNDINSILDIFHKRGKMIPKDLWDAIFQCIINNKYTLGKQGRVFASRESMQNSLSVLIELVAKFKGLWQFNYLRDEAGSKIYGIANKAEINMSDIEMIEEEVEQFNTKEIDLYSDMYLPTYSELFSSEISKAESPEKAEVIFNALMEAFAPKCGDYGITPSIPFVDLMKMTTQDIASTVSARASSYIDPDIFYHRNRDKMLMISDYQNYEARNEGYGIAPRHKTGAGVITLPLNGLTILKNINEEPGQTGDGPTPDIFDKRALGKIFDAIKEPAELAAGAALTDQEESNSEGSSVILENGDVVNELSLVLGTDEKAHAEFAKQLYGAVENKYPVIEFIMTGNNSDPGRVALRLIFNPEKNAYEGSKMEYVQTPTYYQPGSGISVPINGENQYSKMGEQQLSHMPDLTESLLKSFPTARLYFVEEDRKRDYQKDDYHGYKEILECSISSHIYDNDICTMKLANFGGTLSSTSFYNNSDPKLVDDDSGEKFIKTLMLRPGIHIVVKMGYGNNLAALKTVFTGIIAEVKAGQIVEIIAQGFQSELQTDFGGFIEEDFLDMMKHWWPEFASGGYDKHIGFISIINYILLGIDNDPTDSPVSGPYHLGKKIRMNPYRPGGPGSAENVIFSYEQENSNIQRILGSETTVGFISEIEGDNASWGDAFMESNYFGWQGFDLSRNVYNCVGNYAEITSTEVANEWLITNAPAIDGIREVVRYMPNFIATVVPYEGDATLFVGDPCGPYQYREATKEESEYVARYNAQTSLKTQANDFRKLGKYRILAHRINHISDKISKRITRYNRIKLGEIAAVEKSDIHTNAYQLYGASYNAGAEVTVHPTAPFSQADGGFKELEDLVVNTLFRPISDEPYLSDDVHANLLAIFLNLDTSKLDEEAFTKLATASKAIAKIKLNSEQVLNTPRWNSLYNFGGNSFKPNPLYTSISLSALLNNTLEVNSTTISGNAVHHAGQRLDFWPLLISNESDFGLFKSTSKEEGAAVEVNLDASWQVNSTEQIAIVPFLTSTFMDTSRTDRKISIFKNLMSKREELSTSFARNPAVGNSLAVDYIVKTLMEYKQALQLATKLLNPIGLDGEERDNDVLQDIMNSKDDTSEMLPFTHKLFRDHHVVSSDHDLIANNVVATQSDMWSAVSLRVPINTVNETAGWGDWGPTNYGIEEGGINKSAGVFQIDSDQEFGIWPRKNSVGMNYAGLYAGPEDILETFTEINATTPNLALQVNNFRLAQGLSKMYRGNLIMIGRNIKPYDSVRIVDNVNNIHGEIMAERVIQNYSSTSGWTTTVVPVGLTRVNSFLGTYNAGQAERWMYSFANGKTFMGVMDTITVAALFGSIFTGGITSGVWFTLKTILTSGARLAGAGVVVGARVLQRAVWRNWATRFLLREPGRRGYRYVQNRAIERANKRLAEGVAREPLKKMALQAGESGYAPYSLSDPLVSAGRAIFGGGTSSSQGLGAGLFGHLGARAEAMLTRDQINLIAAGALPATATAAETAAYTAAISARNAAIGSIAGAGITAGARAIWLNVVYGRLMLRGGSSVMDEYLNPVISQQTVIDANEGDVFSAGAHSIDGSIPVYLPAKIKLLRYNNTVFSAGLRAIDVASSNPHGIDNIMEQARYLWADFIRSKGEAPDILDQFEEG